MVLKEATLIGVILSILKILNKLKKCLHFRNIYVIISKLIMGSPLLITLSGGCMARISEIERM